MKEITITLTNGPTVPVTVFMSDGEGDLDRVVAGARAALEELYSPIPTEVVCIYGPTLLNGSFYVNDHVEGEVVYHDHGTCWSALVDDHFEVELHVDLAKIEVVRIPIDNDTAVVLAEYASV